MDLKKAYEEHMRDYIENMKAEKMALRKIKLPEIIDKAIKVICYQDSVDTAGSLRRQIDRDFRFYFVEKSHPIPKHFWKLTRKRNRIKAQEGNVITVDFRKARQG